MLWRSEEFLQVFVVVDNGLYALLIWVEVLPIVIATRGLLVDAKCYLKY